MYRGTDIDIYAMFGCLVTPARRCGVKASSPLLDSSGSGTCIFALLVFSGIHIVTLLALLFFWRVFFLLVVFFGFDLSMNPIRQTDWNPKERVREHSCKES